MGHGVLPLAQRGSPHGRCAFDSGRIEMALNEGKDCPQDIAPMYTGSVSGTGMRSCVSQRKPASDVL